MTKERIRDKYWSDRHPNTDLDFVEVALPSESVDVFLRKYARHYLEAIEEADPDQIQQTRKRKDRLLRKIFKAASSGFTDRQFQIFILRYIFKLKETDIAGQIHVDQSYVSNVLKACHQKLHKLLRLNREKVKKQHVRRKKCAK